jgi:hypothetical protein
MKIEIEIEFELNYLRSDLQGLSSKRSTSQAGGESSQRSSLKAQEWGLHSLVAHEVVHSNRIKIAG